MKYRSETAGGDSAAWRFMVFLALVFLAQGVGQIGGIINQPLTYYLKQALHWEPDQVTRFVAVLIIPWIIKPLYGLLSDYVPIFGLRRKPYLFLSNALAVGAYMWMVGLTQPTMILIALFLVAFGMAAASTITEAMLVENGNNWGMAGRFLNQQWLWFNVAAIGSSLLGGWLAQKLAPTSAFHTAALIAACAPVGVLLGMWFLLDEPRAASLRTAVAPRPDCAGGVFTNKGMWVAALFLFVWNIVPSFGTPLYYHMTDDLKFGQQFIGLLGAISSVGSVLGSLLYAGLAKKYKLQTLLYLSVGLGALSQFSYMGMVGAKSAVAISLAGGIIGMLALVSSLTVAAHAAPTKSAGFSFALLMSVNNLSGQLSTNLGASLFVHVFHGHLNPVIFLAGIGTALCGLMIPMLKLGDAGGNTLRPRQVKTVHPSIAIQARKP